MSLVPEGLILLASLTFAVTAVLSGRPKGVLVPKYTVNSTVPGPNNETDKLRQDICPYAPNGPVTYVKPGQKFFETQQTRGGWFQAGRQLEKTLVSAGLLAQASAAHAQASRSRRAS